MAYKVKSLESELTKLCFEARRCMGEASKAGDMKRYEYWRGMNDAYTDAARRAEKHGV